MDEPIVTEEKKVWGMRCDHKAGACNFCGEERAAWLVAGAVLLGSLIIAASLLVSMKPKTLGDAGSPTAAPTTAPTAAGNAANPSGTTMLEKSPVLGDKAKAKVAIVEYSDYECPFCKQFHDQTFDQIVKDFVSTGKAVISFRNFPLPFHEPVASVAAETGLCVREAKGDNAYFAFGKAYYANTQANGKGLATATKMNEILQQVGVNASAVTACAKSEKFKDVIAKDTSDGQAAGVSGTPSFIVGKLDAAGKVTGELMVGAQPYAQFKTTIEKYLQ